MSLSRLPVPFIKRMRAILPPKQFEAVMETFAQERATTFRLNKLIDGNGVSISRLKTSGIHPDVVKDVRDAWAVEPDQRALLLHTEAFETGKIYIQNVSSMIPPLILNPQSAEHILDLAAAPGSKTIQLAGLVGSGGHILAVEKIRKRFYKLRDNLEKNGADFVKTYMGDGERIWKRNMEAFDRVLLDAPCSTEGRFQENESETYRYWSMRKIKEMVRKQSRLLYSAVQCLKPGGTLVYSTCTFAPEENEGVVDRILQQFEGKLSVEEIELPSCTQWMPGLTTWKHKQFDTQVEHARRILPDHIFEGFFICKIKKTDRTFG